MRSAMHARSGGCIRCLLCHVCGGVQYSTPVEHTREGSVYATHTVLGSTVHSMLCKHLRYYVVVASSVYTHVQSGGTTCVHATLHSPAELCIVLPTVGGTCSGSW